MDYNDNRNYRSDSYNSDRYGSQSRRSRFERNRSGSSRFSDRQSQDDLSGRLIDPIASKERQSMGAMATDLEPLRTSWSANVAAV